MITIFRNDCFFSRLTIQQCEKCLRGSTISDTDESDYLTDDDDEDIMLTAALHSLSATAHPLDPVPHCVQLRLVDDPDTSFEAMTEREFEQLEYEDDLEWDPQGDEGSPILVSHVQTSSQCPVDVHSVSLDCFVVGGFCFSATCFFIVFFFCFSLLFSCFSANRYFVLSFISGYIYFLIVYVMIMCFSLIMTCTYHDSIFSLQLYHLDSMLKAVS